MSSLTNPARPVKPAPDSCSLTLEINGTFYACVRLDPDPAVAKVAWRLIKPDGETYAVSVNGHGPSCDCPDFIFRRDGKDRLGCKHVQACRAFGLLGHAGVQPRREPQPLESWRRTWRQGIAPQLSVRGLEVLAEALATDDPALIQGDTCRPAPIQANDQADVTSCCPITLAGVRGAGLVTVSAAVAWFAAVCQECDQLLGEEAGCRWFLNWWDDEDRSHARLELLAEVRRELARRWPAPSVALASA